MRGPVITNLYLSYTLENYKFQKYVYEEKVQYAVIWVLCIYLWSSRKSLIPHETVESFQFK